MAAYQLDDPLPSPPPCNVEQSYERWFQPDVDGTPGNDQFLYLHPNGLCLVGVAPAHAALRPPQPAGGEAGASTAAGAAATEPVQVDAGAAAAAAATQPAEQPAAGASGSEPAAPAAAAGSAAAAAAGSPLQQDGGEGAAESKPPPPASISFKVGRRNLLEAEYRKGRGPCLNPDAGLCRVSAGGAAYTLRALVKGALVDINEALPGLQGSELLRALQESYVAILEPKAAEVQRVQRECLTPAQYAELRGLPLGALRR